MSQSLVLSWCVTASQREQTLPRISLTVATEPSPELLEQGSMLPHETAVRSVRNLYLEVVAIIV